MPDFGEVIRFGLKLEPLAESGQSVARENQIMSDEQVRAIVAAVKETDPDGALSRLVMLLAATGAFRQPLCRSLAMCAGSGECASSIPLPDGRCAKKSGFVAPNLLAVLWRGNREN